MKISIIALVFLLQGCGSLVLCSEREYSFEVPSTIPFLNGEFKIKRSSDHVDCKRPPKEREIQND